jgi:hypothetical protein
MPPVFLLASVPPPTPIPHQGRVERGLLCKRTLRIAGFYPHRTFHLPCIREIRSEISLFRSLFLHPRLLKMPLKSLQWG